MLKANSCCCGCSLRCGSIAIMTIVFPLQTVVGFIVIAIAMMNFREKEPSSDVDISDDAIADDYEDELAEAMLFSVYATVTGLYGVIRKKPKQVVSYLKVQVIYLVAIAGFTVWLMVTPLKVLKVLILDEWYRAPMAITMVLIFGVLLYFFVVVLSYYRKLKKLKKPVRESVLSTGDIPLSIVDII